jgi:hypothetical protein
MNARATATAGQRWLSVQAAAEMLGLTAAALRKSLERRAVRTLEGGIEADIDGVRGRKLGRLWRVALSAAWSEPIRENAGSNREGGR